MPVVPVEQNRVDIAEASGVKLRAPDMSGTGLEALGRGVQAVGQGLGQYAATQDQIQQHADQINARASGIGFDTKARSIVSDFANLQGADAVNQSADYQVRISALRKETLEGMGNARQRAFLAPMLAESEGSALNAIADHSKKQQFTFAQGTYSSGVSNAQQAAVQMAGNPEQQAKSIDEGRQYLAQLGHLEGWDDNTKALKDKEFVSGIHAGVIDHLLAQPDQLDAATGYYQAHKGEMTFAAQNAAEARFKDPLQQRQAASDFMAVASGANGAAPAKGETATIAPGKYQAPVAGKITNTFEQHQERGSAGLDIAAPQGSSIHPIAGGTVTVGQDARSGNYVMVKHPDGTTSSYAHMGNVSVKNGDVVEASDVLGTVGMTGHTTGPHVHLRVRDADGNDVDPQKVIGTQAAGGQVVGPANTPRRWDKATIYANIDAHADWSPERKEAAKRYADRTIGSDEQLLSRQEDEADRQANEAVLAMGDKFTSMNQLPQSIVARMSVEARTKWQAVAKANATPSQPKADGAAAIMLQLMPYYEPDKFKNANLGEWQGKVTPGELAGAMRKQAEMRTKPDDAWSPRTGITSAFQFGKSMDGVKYNPHQEAAILQTMEDEAKAIYARNGNKPLGDADFQGLYRSATKKITTPGVLWGTNQTPRYDVSSVPAAQRKSISDRFQATFHRAPTDDEVLRYYRSYGVR